MSIYGIKLKDYHKLFKKFHESNYGRTVFLLAYFLPFFGTIIAIVLAILGPSYSFYQYLPACIIGIIVTFILGNMYFYHELAEFCERSDQKTSRSARKKK